VPLTIHLSLLLSLSFPLSLGARSVSWNSQQGVPRPELGSSCPHVRHRPFCRRQEHCEDEEQREGAVPARQATDQRQAGRPHKAAERPGRNGIHPPYLLLRYFSRASSSLNLTSILSLLMPCLDYLIPLLPPLPQGILESLPKPQESSLLRTHQRLISSPRPPSLALPFFISLLCRSNPHP
jgi:hypothetical protein